MSPSDSQLDALAVVHYVVAGFIGLVGLMPLLHVAMGLALVSGHFPFGPPGHPPPDFPPMVGWFFVAIGGVFVLVAQAMAVTLAFVGTYLRKRRRWLFCVVVDAVACSIFPVGTALGVVTLVLLSQPEVKACFSSPVAT